MTIKYFPEQPFFGRVYTNGFSDIETCYADGNYRNTITLQIPLGRNACGLSETRSEVVPTR